MSSRQKQWWNVPGNRPLVAGALLCLFLFVLALAQSGTLHRFVHGEADHANHYCVVTLLTGGQVDAASTQVQVAVTSTMIFLGEQPAALLLVTADYSLLPGRGPPALLT